MSAVWLWAWLLACRGGDDDRPPGGDDGPGVTDTVPSDGSTGDTGSTPGPQILFVLEPTVEASEVVPTVHQVHFTSEPGAGTVELLLDDGRLGPWERAESTPAGTTDHHVRLLGLKAGARYRWRARVDADDGRLLGAEEGLLQVPSAPEGLPPTIVRGVVPAALAHERFYVLFNIVGYDTSYAIVVDQDGDPVWWVRSAVDNENIVIVQPSLDGEALMHGLLNTEGPHQGVTRTPVGVMTADEQVFTRMPAGHHGFAETGDGHLAFLSHDVDPVSPWDEHPTAAVQTSTILEMPIGSDDPHEAVRRFAVMEQTDWVENGHTCSHNQAYDFRGELSVDFGHANSLVYLPETDAFYVNFRNLDRVTKIDRATGEVQWNLGGEGSDFVFDDPSTAFEHGHFTHLWADGFAMFSNELHTRGSRVMVYGFDEATGTVSTDFVYDDPQGRTVEVLGDIDVISPTHALVSWATTSEVTVLSRSGSDAGADVAWKLIVDDATVGRVTYLTDLYSLR